MPKAEPGITPTLGTGNRSGFTLLEVLAVIILIGLALSLAQPAVERSLEKTRIQAIAKLLRADVATLRETAATERSAQVVDFTAQGYAFQLGEHPIRRDFSGEQFHFVIPAAAPEPEPSREPDSPGDGESPPEPASGSRSALQLLPDGSTPGMQLAWRTRHFQGRLVIREDGEVQWNDAPQSAGDQPASR